MSDIVEGGAPSAEPQAAPAPSAEPVTPNPASPPQGESQAGPPGLPPGVSWRDGAYYFTAKVDGREITMPYEEAAMRLRTHESSTQRYQEAKRIERETEALFQRIATDPRAFAAFARQLNVDPRELAEAWQAEYLEESQLTPEQKRLREAEQRIARYEQEARERQERAEQEQWQREQQQERSRLVSVFDAELEAIGAPKGERVRGMVHQRMAQLAAHHEQNGIHTTLSAIAKKALSDVMGLASEFAPPPAAPAAPPKAPPPPVAPPPPPADQQPRSQYVRDDRGRFADDPKPVVSANIPGSMDALIAWKKRNPGRA